MGSAVSLYIKERMNEIRIMVKSEYKRNQMSCYLSIVINS